MKLHKTIFVTLFTVLTAVANQNAFAQTSAADVGTVIGAIGGGAAGFNSNAKRQGAATAGGAILGAILGRLIGTGIDESNAREMNARLSNCVDSRSRTCNWNSNDGRFSARTEYRQTGERLYLCCDVMTPYGPRVACNYLGRDGGWSREDSINENNYQLLRDARAQELEERMRIIRGGGDRYGRGGDGSSRSSLSNEEMDEMMARHQRIIDRTRGSRNGRDGMGNCNANTNCMSESGASSTSQRAGNTSEVIVRNELFRPYKVSTGAVCNVTQAFIDAPYAYIAVTSDSSGNAVCITEGVSKNSDEQAKAMCQNGPIPYACVRR